MDITRAKAFLLYRVDLAILRGICSAEERARIYLAVEEWFFTGEIAPDMVSNFAFHSIISKVEEAQEKHESKADKVRANGLLGGRPKTKKTNLVFDNQNNQLGYEENAEPKKPNITKHNITKHNITKQNNNICVSVCSDVEFDKFWCAYNKKIGKPAALRAFVRAKNSKEWSGIDNVLAAIERWNNTEDWQKDGGRYKPHPATWLNRQGWLDECAGEGVEASQPPPPMLLTQGYHFVDC